MNSCPKCGSITVIVSEKKGHCGNRRCGYVGAARLFQGLSGQREDPLNSPRIREWIPGGSMKRPVFEDDNDYD